MEYTPRMTENMLAAHSAAVNSMVLLKNVAGTLPLRPAGSEKLPIAVFGMGQIETACCCEEFKTYRKVSILDGLCASRLVQPDGLLAHKYRNWKLNEPGKVFPWSSLSMEELADNNAAAVVVLTRTEESYDTIVNNDERDMVRAIAAAFDRVVLVVNAPGYVEIAPIASLCGAVVYMGVAGQEGGAALAELLTGDALFRGHLNQSWPMRRADFTQANQSADIYCGYRYFDTFGTELLYDFGHGLTYGAAEIESVSVAVDGTEVVVSAAVANVGDNWPVSQVVQVYASRPDGRLAQPKYVFQGFAATKVLDPGQVQTVTIRFPVGELSTFSEESSAFILEAGYYDIRVGFSARSAMVAGSLKLLRDEVVLPVMPMQMPKTKNRPAPMSFALPGETEELAAVRKHAIRLSSWNIPRVKLRKPRAAQLCRGAETPVRLENVARGENNLYELVGGMDSHDLRALVLDFGFKQTSVPGALGASADLMENYGIPAMTIAAGADGVLLTRDLRDEEGNVTGHQYCTAFPAASLLGCSWNLELIASVGAAIGREMKEFGVDLWLAPGADVLRSPGQRHASRCWAEEPVLCGVYTLAMAKGVEKYGAAVLRAVSMEHKDTATQRAYQDIYSLGFAIAAPSAAAVLLPTQWLNGEPSGEDTAQSEALCHEWKFRGMFLADDERFTAEPTRLQLEQAALRILRFALKRL
ncbi:MAG: glycoside hydrolase family 3 C-terminal domain-containing protein [Oscillospiraceae bacterium]|nr:glycoside hydrolase family 3 C-terminal domain-containing protein [Oscillospiraceae bacterium]